LKNFDGSDEKLLDKASTQLNGLQYKYSSEEGGPITIYQKALLIGLVILALLPIFFVCGGWIYHVESSLIALQQPSPTPTATFTPTPTITLTPTPTNTGTPTITPTPSNTPTPTNTATPTATRTPKPPTPTSTFTPTPSPFSGVMIGSVYLRDEPSLESRRAGPVAPLGAKVEILAEYDDWYRVRGVFRNQPNVEVVGWVPANWVTLVRPVPTSLVTPTTTPTP
jgi:hypothetical protein